MIRKRFVKEASGPAWAKAPEEQDEVTTNMGGDQNEIVNNLEQNNRSLCESNKLLENKLAMAEASAYKAFKEKADEIAILKNNMKTNKSEMDALRRDLNQEKKMMKEKEKEVLRLGQKCDNLLDNAKKLKCDIAENKKLLKENRKSDKSKKKVIATTEPVGDLSQSSNIFSIQTISTTPQPITYFKGSFLDNNSNCSSPVSNITPLLTPQPSCLNTEEKTTPSSCSPRTPPGTPPAFKVLSSTARKLPPAYQQMIAGVEKI